VTRTPTWRQRAGTRRFGQRGRSPDPSRSLLTGPSRRRTSEAGDPHAHVIAAKKAGHEVGRDQVARLTAVSGIWGRRVSPRADERDAVVPTSLPTSFSGSFDPHAGRVSDRTSVDTTEEMVDVSLLDATRCRIVGGEVASPMTVQTVLSLLWVARLRRGAFHDALSFSLDRAHFDAGREDQPSARLRAEQRSARSPPSGNRESDDTARRRA